VRPRSCAGCVRAAVQSTAMGYGEVTETNVYLCTGDPLPDDITAVVKSLLNDSFSDAFACMMTVRARSLCLHPQLRSPCPLLALPRTLPLSLLLSPLCHTAAHFFLLCIVALVVSRSSTSRLPLGVRAVIRTMCVTKGYALTDVLTQVCKYARRLGLPPGTAAELLSNLSDVE
jgi:hypothetical protein